MITVIYTKRRKKKIKEQLKVSQIFSGRKNLLIKVCVYPVSSFKLIPPYTSLWWHLMAKELVGAFMVRREYLSQRLHLMFLEMMNVLARKLCTSWEIYTFMSSIKNVNCILLQVGADYSNYYYLLFFEHHQCSTGQLWWKCSS